MELYQRYFNHKDEIEDTIGTSLEWMELPNKKASRIKLSKVADFANKDDWNEQFKWIKRYAELFADTFIKFAK